MDEPIPIAEIISDNDSLKSKSSGRGGKREGAGRPKGSLDRGTVEIKAAKKIFQERVANMADRLLNAQANRALGESYLYVQYYVGTGKERKKVTDMITDPEIIKQYIDDTLDTDNDEYYYISTKPADTIAIDSLLNRSFGKATEKVEIDSGGFFKADKMIIEVVRGTEQEEDSDGTSTTDDPGEDSQHDQTEA